MPSLLVEMFAYCSGDAANRSLASASAHDETKADEARPCVLALYCRAVQVNRIGKSQTTQGAAEVFRAAAWQLYALGRVDL
jgi:hypothetical protein